MQTTFLILFVVATGVAVIARRFGLPYTVALVLAGLALGALENFKGPELTPELLFTFILPGLLFEAAFHIDFELFWKSKLGIIGLALPGVAAGVAITAALLGLAVPTLGFIAALVFAAVTAATDPIAVVALFKSVGAPARLTVLVDGESLLNDGTGMVLFTVVLAMATGAATGLLQGTLDFVRIAGGGALIGLTIGWLGARLTQRLDDPMVEITLTVLVAYGSFVAADRLHLSGVIATVVAGMLFGNQAVKKAMSPSTLVAVKSFWEYVAFALNSIVFLLIGLEVRLTALLASAPAILLAYLAMMLARAAIVFGASLVLRKTQERFSRQWAAVITWAGLRGALSMVLALSIPASLPYRELLVNMTFGVVVLSIVVQGLTMRPLMKWLKVS
ncbi:MAG: cation:proton antiporter [Myxococcaceae bacterium]